MKTDLTRLSKRLGYTFKNLNHLKQALTHCSMGEKNYERFEFLGDSILSFVIADALYHEASIENEGQMSRLRSFLVKGDSLAEIATEIGLGDFLFLGQGELKSGGFRRASILADALEAVFAAVYLDGGIEPAKAVILKLYSSRLESSKLSDSFKDFKTQLQEYLQAKKYPLPSYDLTKIEGIDHEQMFYIQCQVNGIDQYTQGKGTNRRKAEQIAAHDMLNYLKASK